MSKTKVRPFFAAFNQKTKIKYENTNQIWKNACIHDLGLVALAYGVENPCNKSKIEHAATHKILQPQKHCFRMYFYA